MGYGLVNVFVLPINTVLLPSALMLGMGMSSEVYGLVEGFAASGMVAGAALVALGPERFGFARNYRWFFPLPVALGIMACAVWAGMSAPGDVGMPVFVTATCAMEVMLCPGVTNVVKLAYNQTSVPPAMLGSLSALSTAFASSTVPVGQVVFGALIDSGVGYSQLLCGAVVASAIVCAFVRWNTRRA